MSELKQVVKYLLGEGELDGCHFGEFNERIRPNFWWRKNLREAWNSRPNQWVSVEDRLPDAGQSVLVWSKYATWRS